MRTLSILFFVLFVFSCNPESDNTVIIGDGSKNYAIIQPEPAILITMSHQDSLDLNSDGIFEIKFIISPIRTSTTESGSKTEIYTKNKLQILLSTINGSPDTLRIKSLLNSDSHWSDWTGRESFTFLLQSYACYTYFHCLGDGNFLNVSGRYLGYKIEEKYGWILIDSSTSGLIIKEYTLLK